MQRPQKHQEPGQGAVLKPRPRRSSEEEVANSATVLVGPPAHLGSVDLTYSVAVHTRGPLFDKPYSVVNRRHSHFAWLVRHVKPSLVLAPPLAATPTSYETETETETE